MGLNGLVVRIFFLFDSLAVGFRFLLFFIAFNLLLFFIGFVVTLQLMGFLAISGEVEDTTAATIAYGSWVVTWFTCSHWAPADAMIVVSEIGEQ